MDNIFLYEMGESRVIILSLDLSLSSTGFSIIDDEYNLISYGTIQRIIQRKKDCILYGKR